MVVNIPLGGKPLILEVTLKSNQSKRVNLQLVDPQHRNTSYQSRECHLNGVSPDRFEIRLPESPYYAKLVIWEPGKPETKMQPLADVKVLSIKKLPLQRRIDMAMMDSPLVDSFIGFCVKFCKKAGYLSAGSMKSPSVYKSDNGQFEIRYFDRIEDEKGNPINTPARVNQQTGVIEVSAEKFRKYSVPMRMAIMLHEFSHYWLNKDKTNEVEADLNALLIYLGLGYPRIDARNVFIKVFGGADTPENRQRYKILDDFIKNFDNMQIQISQSPSLRMIQQKVMGRGLRL